MESPISQNVEEINQQICASSGETQELSIQTPFSVKPKSKKYHPEELLAGITEDNLHEEIDTGNAVGNEVW